MAGIGFRLRKLLKGDSYADLFRAYAYSAFIMAGPMLVVVLSLTAVRLLVQGRLGLSGANHFMGVVIYAYASSMIVTGPFVYVVTRYLADLHYLKRIHGFTSVYFSTIYVVFVLQILVFVFGFMPFFNYSLEIAWILLSLTLAIVGIWIAMLFLSAAKNYQWVVLAYALGGLIGAVASIWMGFKSGFPGFLKGYAFGQVLTFLVLSIRVFREFGFSPLHDFGFLSYFFKHPHLMGVGLFYYLAIWVDKFIFWWFSPISQIVGPGLHVAPDYDTYVFFAYLTVIPSLAFFLIQMETDFARIYHFYFKVIKERGSLSEINYQYQRLLDVTAANFQRYVLFQGLITAVILIFIDNIAEAFHMNPRQMGIFRISVLGSFVQMGFLMVMNLMFYFDFQKDVFRCCLFYFISNILLTWASLEIGLPAYGFGYATASFLTLVLSFYLFRRRLDELNYRVFMLQPILVPRLKLETEQEKI